VRIENLIAPSNYLREGGLRTYLIATGRYDEVIKETRRRLAGKSNEEVLDAAGLWVSLWARDLALAGELERAIELMESLRHVPGSGWGLWEYAPLFLAELYQAVGREDEAVPLLDEIVTDLEAEFASGIRDPHWLGHLAEAYARQQRDKRAIDMLQKAVDYHLRISCNWWEILLVQSPWSRLKDNPRLIALCERMEADLEQQADRIRTMLAEHDIDELLAPLMALAEETVAEAE